MQIQIEDLSKRYSRHSYAIRGLNIEINNGLYGLLGPNGAGKTTLMRILVTLLKPSRGKVTVDGLDLQKHRKDIRGLIGYLPQNFHTFSKMSTWEFLDYSASLSGVRRRVPRFDKIDEMLEAVGLFDVRDRRAHKLSGGMKRRLGIAQTLIGGPKIIVIDEPTVGLDPEERVRFRNLLSDLSHQDVIILLSTHIVGDISSTCANVTLLNLGKTVYNGAPDGLIKAARGKVWQTFASDLELDKLQSEYTVISTIPSAQGYEVRMVTDEVKGREAVLVEPNMEDAYISYMQSAGAEGILDGEEDDY